MPKKKRSTFQQYTPYAPNPYVPLPGWPMPQPMPMMPMMPQPVPQPIPQLASPRRVRSYRQTPSVAPRTTSPVVSDKATSPEDVFKQAFQPLAWYRAAIPDASHVKTLFVADFQALFRCPSPNPEVLTFQSIRTIEQIGDSGWWTSPAVLETALEHVPRDRLWNTTLLEMCKLACADPNCVVVVHSTRFEDQIDRIDEILRREGVAADLIAFGDKLQPPRLRKHRLVARLWHFFDQSQVMYVYETPKTHRDSREMRATVRELVTSERSSIEVHEVLGPRSYLPPVVERGLVKTLVEAFNASAAHPLSASILTEMWIWRIENWAALVAEINKAAETICGGVDNITDYVSSCLEFCPGDMPAELQSKHQRGETAQWTLIRLSANFCGVQATFQRDLDEKKTVLVAKLKQRVDFQETNAWLVLSTKLEPDRRILLKARDDDPI